MATVRLGPIVSAISGTVGSVVFIAGGRSTVARLRPVTLHKTSTFLDRSKTRMQNLQNHWSTLTSLQQDAWRTAAAAINTTNALGQSSPMSGFHYFILTNKVTFPGAFAIVDAPSPLRFRDVIVNPSVSFSVSSGFDVSIDNPSAPLGLQLQVYGWPFWRDTQSREVARLVFLKERAAFSDPVADNVQPQWLHHFGPMVEGQRFACGLKARSSASPFIAMTVIRGTVAA